ncbi:hypothetical protein LTS07_005009 [Exophiala sideris]|uniref:Uncharacterized protein n=1 Tax=Exophiala sideris TaxID=1016849 RepID=A0ABR0JDS7_9EURO|nr:hypothetical protein LTS07_005009 [Exophiala sideris]KAK5038994.1 hypothetical protein LTR13_004025 [Exophiala sideris]KAK5060879.1 hypothetical protein LTR69_005478 [Exophiala sideris]KAK5183790.1 hypothetical protein LTR44_004072 [Eurotiomycetes sp. CCFEE 6388]
MGVLSIGDSNNSNDERRGSAPFVVIAYSPQQVSSTVEHYVELFRRNEMHVEIPSAKLRHLLAHANYANSDDAAGTEPGMPLRMCELPPYWARRSSVSWFSTAACISNLPAPAAARFLLYQYFVAKSDGPETR